MSRIDLAQTFPFRMKPTNLEGVYTPVVPVGFDARTATDAEFRNAGLLLRRPKPGARSAVWSAIEKHGLRVIEPEIGPVTEGFKAGQALNNNWCGAVLQGAGNWVGVEGEFTLPFLKPSPLPNGATNPSGTSAWVGLGGYLASEYQLFQAVVEFGLAIGSNPPFTSIGSPVFQWFSPKIGPPVGGLIKNPPPMASGDLLWISCEYFPTAGMVFGSVSFIWTKAGGGHQPVAMHLFAQGPAGALATGKTVEWIMENESVTLGQPNTVFPQFSAQASQITPISFTHAAGHATTGPGDPAKGFTLEYEDNNNQPTHTATVFLSPNTVSIAYTGPTS